VTVAFNGRNGVLQENTIPCQSRGLCGKASVCDCSIPGTVGSNPAGGMNVHLMCLLCVVLHSFRGILTGLCVSNCVYHL
jgi:hypothetical protein